MTLGGNLTLGGLQFDSTLAGAVTITDTHTLTLGSGGIYMSDANQDVALNCPVAMSGNLNNTLAGKALKLGGVVSGSGMLINTGSGPVILTNANIYSGGTSNSGPTLYVTNTLGSLGSGPVYLNGGSLYIENTNNPTFANNMTLIGSPS